MTKMIDFATARHAYADMSGGYTTNPATWAQIKGIANRANCDALTAEVRIHRIFDSSYLTTGMASLVIMHLDEAIDLGKSDLVPLFAQGKPNRAFLDLCHTSY